MIGGLAAAAQLCTLGTTAGLFLWARGLHSRLAGVSAALLAGAVYPLLHMGKTLSFYPESTAVYTLAMGALALAARFRHWALFLATGVGLGLTLLVGLRGLFWALPMLGLALALCVWPPWRQVPLRVALLVLPLLPSYGAGRLLYFEDTGSLESQLDLPRILGEIGVDVPPRRGESSRYVWGWTPVTDIPATLGTLWKERELIPPAQELEHITRAGREQHVEPWLVPLAGALLALLWGLRKRPDLLIVLLGSCLPFLLAFQGAVRFQWGQLRFIGQASPFIPLVLAVGFASLAGQEPEGLYKKVERPAWGPQAWASALAPVLLLFAWVLGILPSFLGPTARWKPGLTPTPDGSGLLTCLVAEAHGPTLERCRPSHIPPPCAAQLAQDASEGRDRVAAGIAAHEAEGSR